MNGELRSDPGHRLVAGDAVTIAWNRPGTGRAHRSARAAVAGAGIRILHEDAWLLAVDKPPGLLTDAATRAQRRDRDTVTERLRRYLRPQGKTPLPAHRIDRDTSGVVLVAKDRATFDALRAQFHARTPERVYVAVLDGCPEPRAGTWADWMAWDDRERVQRPADADARRAVLASAHYRVLSEPGRNRSVVEVRLVTGRRNQIRLHAALRGHPLVGERQYLSPGASPRPAGIARQALHARLLAFDHPDDGNRVVVESPLPADLSALI